jgi:hypothetical protein
VLSRIKMNKLEYRVVIKFLTKQGKAPKIIREEMLAVYGMIGLPNRLFGNGQNCLNMVENCLNMVENHWMMISGQVGLLMRSLRILSKKPTIWYWKMQD